MGQSSGSAVAAAEADTAFVVPPSRTVHVFGEPVEITPVDVQTAVRLIELAGPLFNELLALDELTGAFKPNAGVDEIAALAGALARQGFRIVKAVAIAARVDEQQVEAMLPDRFLALTAAVLEVNRDFFVAAAPGLRAACSRLRMLAPTRSPGATPSSS
jgi:hypothetical protein